MGHLCFFTRLEQNLESGSGVVGNFKQWWTKYFDERWGHTKEDPVPHQGIDALKMKPHHLARWSKPGLFRKASQTFIQASEKAGLAESFGFTLFVRIDGVNDIALAGSHPAMLHVGGGNVLLDQLSELMRMLAEFVSRMNAPFPGDLCSGPSPTAFFYPEMIADLISLGTIQLDHCEPTQTFKDAFERLDVQSSYMRDLSRIPVPGALPAPHNCYAQQNMERILERFKTMGGLLYNIRMNGIYTRVVIRAIEPTLDEHLLLSAPRRSTRDFPRSVARISKVFKTPNSSEVIEYRGRPVAIMQSYPCPVVSQ